MVITALLTGRGNNTLKDKNVSLVCGRPLLYYPAIAAKKSKYIKEFYVSSDNDNILTTAHKFGYSKILRPPELSKPESPHIDAITHALEFIYRKNRIKPGILIVLLANSATIKAEWIDESIDIILKDSDVSAVVPVNLDLDHHPYRAKKIGKESFLDVFFNFGDEQISTNRQDLEPSYFLCHNFWVLNVSKSIYSKEGQAPWRFMGTKIKPLVVEKCFDVHDIEDIELSEKWVKRNWVYE